MKGKDKMQKWEYCVIPLVKSGYGETYRNPELWYLDPAGTQVTHPPVAPLFGGSKGIKRKTDAIMRTIAKLGEEGWELVGCGSDDPATGHMLYFKRPKET